MRKIKRQNPVFIPPQFQIALFIFCLCAVLAMPKAFAANSKPEIISVSPDSGSSNVGETVFFTAVYKDSGGWGHLRRCKLLINTKISSKGCYAVYKPRKNKLYLKKSKQKGVCPGSAVVLENSYAALDCSKTTVTAEGDTITIKWAVAFKNTFKGQKDLYLYARDKKKKSGWRKMGAWTVSNRPPKFEPMDKQSVYENEVIEFAVQAYDPDGDKLTYSVYPWGLPENATFKGQTFKWRPGYDEGIMESVLFRVTDGEYSDELRVYIMIKNSNRPPRLRKIGDKSVKEGNILTFKAKADDPDGYALTYSALNMPLFASFDREMGDFTWAPDYNAAGRYKVILTVTDGQLADQKTVVINVKNNPSRVLKLGAISGYLDGDYVGLILRKNGQTIFSNEGHGTGRGINIAVINEASGELEDMQNFDNWYSRTLANKAMVDYIEAIPEGRIIMAGISDEGSYINESTYQAFESIGSRHIRDIRYGDDWVMVTKKDILESIAEKRVPDRGEGCEIEPTIELNRPGELNPPEGEFSINNGDNITDSSEVILDLSQIDDRGSGMDGGARMKFSNDGIIWSVPEYFKPEKKWYLNRGDGEKTVYARFADADGNWNNESITSPITLDEKGSELAKISGGKNIKHLKAARDGNRNVYVIWSESWHAAKQRVFISVSNDGGITWSEEAKMIYSPDPATFEISLGLCCDDGGNVYAIFGCRGDIYLNFSNDYGQSWISEPIKLNDGVCEDLDCVLPEIICDDNGNVYTLWVNKESIVCKDLWFKRSNDYGHTWTDSVIISEDKEFNSHAHELQKHFLCDEKGGVFAIWASNPLPDDTFGGRDIYFTCSLDEGRTWTSDILKINGVSRVECFKNVEVGTDGNDALFVSWCDYSAIYFQRSLDKGNTWLAKEIKAVKEDPQYDFCMANDNAGSIYLVWERQHKRHRYPDRSEIYFSRSEDYGSTWQKKYVRIVTSPIELTEAWNPLISCDNNGRVYILWRDSRNYMPHRFMPVSKGGNSGGHLYCRYSDDFGTTWPDDDIRLSATYPYIHPSGISSISVCCDEHTGVFYTVWGNEDCLRCDVRDMSEE